MLHAMDLTKRYGDVTALHGFTLDVRPGEIVGLVGHNGAGKTTFLDIVCGLVRADSGTVTIDGRTPRVARGKLGVAPQHIALYPGATAREHLVLYGRLAGLRRAALTAGIREAAEAMLLTELLDRRTGLLSGGQQRRVQAAIALVHRPGLLLLDEPTAGADPQTRQSLLTVVRDRAAAGAAVVYTTHYLPELAELDATLAVAKGGRIIARGTSGELLRDLTDEVRVQTDDEEIRMRTTDPASTLVELLSATRSPVRGIDIRKASLDDLYRSLA
ncbi:ABC transporter ATP-binding protein [Micromonospora echinospora]|uniref:ABC transporter ATP-binding protein n=1 Tax=Micromonospora echinospora TaxID=1877 RepID=UPI0037A9D70C